MIYILVILTYAMIIRFKKKTQEFCEMETIPEQQTDQQKSW